MKRRSLISVIAVLMALLGIALALTTRELRQDRLKRQLIAAIKQRHTQEALALLDEGADGNAHELPPDHRNILKRLYDLLLHGHQQESAHAPTALLLALTPPDDAYNGSDQPRPEDPRLVRALLQHGAAVNVQNDEGETPLLLASAQGQFLTVQMLVDSGADIHVRDQYTTPLFNAAESGSAPMVRLLLARGADVNEATRYGTPLLGTASAEVVKLLLERGADPHARTSAGKWAGDSSLLCAIRHDDRKGAEMLLARGIDINDGNIDGYTPLMYYAQYGGVDDLKFLLHRAAHVNAITKDGLTALMCACDDGITGNIAMLLHHGANVNARYSDGQTALMTATEDGNDRAIKLLLDHGADVNARNKDGKTALMTAAEDGDDSAAELLLGYGAKINARDRSSKTALSYAEELKAEESDATIVETLREHGATR